MSPARKIRRQRVGTGVEHGHPRLALDVVLPLVGVGVPVHLPDAAGRHGHQRGCDGGGYLEVGAVGDADASAGILLDRGRAAERIDERVGRRFGILRDRPRDPRRDRRARCPGRSRDRSAESWRTRRPARRSSWPAPRAACGRASPVTSSVLNSLALPSSKQITNSQPSGPRPCSECGAPDGKYQRSPALTSGDIGAALYIEHGDAAGAVGHDRPFGSLVPMQLADAAGGKPHVDAGDFLRDGEIGGGDLPGPAAVLDAPRTHC